MTLTTVTTWLPVTSTSNVIRIYLKRAPPQGAVIPSYLHIIYPPHASISSEPHLREQMTDGAEGEFVLGRDEEALVSDEG